MQRMVLRDGAVEVAVLSYGARVQDWRVPVGEAKTPAVLGYADPEAYRRDPFFLGALVGRVANRIGGAAYGDVRLVANEGPNQLHGGPGGLWAVDWRMESDGPRRLRLSHHSPAGDMGFPGAVDVTVDMALDGHRLSWDMQAMPDHETPISLTQHNYYALGGPVTARIAADRHLARDAAGIMSGAVLPAGPFDCRQPRPLPPEADDFLVFEAGRDPSQPVAELHAPGGLRLRMWSDQPGAQLYAGQWLRPPFLPGQAFCLEPSGYPNAVNIPAFPSVMATPDRPYRQRLSVEITPETQA